MSELMHEPQQKGTAAGRSAQRSGAIKSGVSTGVNVGRLLGVPIRIDYGLVFIFGLVVLNLGSGLFPAWHPTWSPALRWGVAFGAAVLFFVSVLLHELSHAVVGRALGVKIGGITLFMFGGMAHLEREPERPSAELWMAAVGPLTSFIIGFGAIAAGRALGAHTLDSDNAADFITPIRELGPVATLLLWLGPVNIALAVFNLLPGFPLDGGRVTRALLWATTGDFVRATRWASYLGRGLAWLLIGAGMFMLLGARVPLLGQSTMQGLWLILIGWFLNSAAQAAYEQVLVKEAVRGVPVRALMDTRVEAVSPNLSVGALIHERLLHGDQRCFPVATEGNLEGLVCLDDIRRVSRASWNDTPVSEVMTRARDLSSLGPNDEVERAVELLAERDVDQIPIVDKGMLRGVVRRRDVIRWLALRQESA
jgi:Zn-dependent protease/CBS domain-containing protein